MSIRVMFVLQTLYNCEFKTSPPTEGRTDSTEEMNNGEPS